MPQLAVSIVFFFWPAAQALLQSVRREDAFGLSTRFVGLDNFAAIFADPSYLASVEISFVFSLAVAALALGSGLLVRGDGRPGGARCRLLQDGPAAPYAIAPAIAGVLWLFLFNPGFGIVGSRCGASASTGITC